MSYIIINSFPLFSTKAFIKLDKKLKLMKKIPYSNRNFI